MKELVIKDNNAFTFRIKKWKCTSPNNLTAIEFNQDHKDNEGIVTNTNSYRLFMTDDELKILVQGLTS